MAATADPITRGLIAPDFILPGTDGQRWTRDAIVGPHGLLIMFICNHCPYVQAVIDRVVRDARALQDAGIGVAAISSNDVSAYPQDGFPAMREFSQRHGFSFPYLYDESQDVAREYGAVCTPDFFGFNRDLELEYRGRLDASGTGVTLIHRLRYTGNLPVEFASWVPTMMAPGGLGVHPFPPRGTHPENLQPTNPLVMWAFSDLSDDRWKFTKKYLTLRQVPGRAVPTKLGTFNQRTIGAYLLNGEIFVKQYLADPSKTYPEFNCSFETFTNQDFLELETLGPVTRVAGGQTVEHIEKWALGKGAIGEISDAELDRVLQPVMQQLGR